MLKTSDAFRMEVEGGWNNLAALEDAVLGEVARLAGKSVDQGLALAIAEEMHGIVHDRRTSAIFIRDVESTVLILPEVMAHRTGIDCSLFMRKGDEQTFVVGASLKPINKCLNSEAEICKLAELPEGTEFRITFEQEETLVRIWVRLDDFPKPLPGGNREMVLTPRTLYRISAKHTINLNFLWVFIGAMIILAIFFVYQRETLTNARGWKAALVVIVIGAAIGVIGAVVQYHKIRKVPRL